MDYLKDFHHMQRVLKELAIEIPEELSCLTNLRKVNAKSSDLSTKTKELISLALAIAADSSGCMAIHIQNALDAGASQREIIETIGVTIMAAGSPAAISGSRAFEALKSLSKKQEPALLYDD